MLSILKIRNIFYSYSVRTFERAVQFGTWVTKNADSILAEVRDILKTVSKQEQILCHPRL